MKKIITKISLCLSLIATTSSFAQYSNASLSGPWMTFTDTYTYLIFDGNGNINEFGVFDGVTGSNVGTYNVASNGDITGNFSIFSANFVGQMTSTNAGSINITGLGTIPLDKITSPGALTETLAGTLVDVSTSTTKNVVFTMNSIGQISNATGLTGVTGRIFTQNGFFAGYISSTDNSQGSCFQKMMISGNYSNNILAGDLKLDCNGHDNATVSLTRTGNPTMVGLLSDLEKSNFKVYPNPFNDKLTIEGNKELTQLQLIDIQGKVILSQELNTGISHVENLDSIKNGVYILKLTQNNSSISYKIIK